MRFTYAEAMTDPAFYIPLAKAAEPALLAKQAGSLAAMIGDRLSLGVGTSPWPEDYELMRVPFARRGKRMDECIEIIRGLTTGDYFEFHGEFYDIPKTKMTHRRLSGPLHHRPRHRTARPQDPKPADVRRKGDRQGGRVAPSAVAPVIAT